MIKKAYSLSEKSDHKEQKPTTRELLCTMVFEDFEWHIINEVDFDGVENDIPDITHGPDTPALDNIEAVLTDA